PAPAGEPGRVKASPYVRKLARERDLSLAGVTGSGPGGRIVARDLDALPKAAPAPAEAPAPAPAPAQAPAAAPGELAAPEVRPLSMMRKAIARRLVESKQTVPHFYLTIDVDADPLNALREQINAELAAAAEAGKDATKISLNDLIVKACAIALRRVPECNAQYTPDAILVHRRVDISVAVAVSEGLVTPVVRDADKKSITTIGAEIRDLAGRAKAKKLKPEEMANGTFSISNLGMYGIDEFSAVINPPEGAILAVGQVRREPVVKGDAVVPGRRLAMTLSCDHRVIDGAIGATFLKALRALLERPMQILVS
ncbi:MAG TPA: dihydrolipoamide acetyltransferase family protein, partial [Polyangium sp.]|nr:dihydrolipoamide acetyltransferase family protein [Polyangium sp.]